MKYGLLYFVLIILLTSCHTTPNSPKEILERFERNKKAFEKLQSDLQNTKDVEQLFDELHRARKSNEFPEPIHQQLKLLGISKVYLHMSACENYTKWTFVFQASWNPGCPIIVLKDRCDSIQTKKGYYRKDSNNNEFMGAGDFWIVYKEIKPFAVKL